MLIQMLQNYPTILRGSGSGADADMDADAGVDADDAAEASCTRAFPQ